MALGSTGKRLRLDPQGQVHIDDVPIPEVGPSEVLVRSTLSQVSAGTEMNDVRKRRRAGADPADFADMGLGYTTAGIVEAVGANVTSFRRRATACSASRTTRRSSPCRGTRTGSTGATSTRPTSRRSRTGSRTRRPSSRRSAMSPSTPCATARSSWGSRRRCTASARSGCSRSSSAGSTARTR